MHACFFLSLRSDSVRNAVGKDLEENIKSLKKDRNKAQEIVDKNQVDLFMIQTMSL